MKSAIVVVAAVAVLVAGAIVFTVMRHRPPLPDAFAGTYPTARAEPTGATWAPTGPPKGPLPTFGGDPSPVRGRITDRRAGVSYPRLGPPWRLETGFGTHTAGEIIDSKVKSLGGYWYVGVYSAPLQADLAPAATGPNALRAAAELTGVQETKTIFDEGDPRVEIAGAPMMAGGHRAWVTAFRMTHHDGIKRAAESETKVIIAVDAGRRVPAVIEISVPSNQQRRLADVNTVARSVRVVP